jgi:hypothetical protein
MECLFVRGHSMIDIAIDIAAVLEHPAQTKVVVAGRGTGKTTLCLEYVKEGMAKGENCAYWTPSPQTMRSLLSRFGGVPRYQITQQDGMVNDTVIQALMSDDPEVLYTATPSVKTEDEEAWLRKTYYQAPAGRDWPLFAISIERRE